MGLYQQNSGTQNVHVGRWPGDRLSWSCNRDLTFSQQLFVQSYSASTVHTVTRESRGTIYLATSSVNSMPIPPSSCCCVLILLRLATSHHPFGLPGLLSTSPASNTLSFITRHHISSHSALLRTCCCCMPCPTNPQCHIRPN